GLPFVLTVLVAARSTGRSDWPSATGMVVVGAIVTVLGSLGAFRLLAGCEVGWGWVAAGSLVSIAGVWAGVPETGPALITGGALAGLAVATAVTRSHWVPSAGLGIAAVVGWAALAGAVGRPWATLGGALCTGVAPWVALRHPKPV